MHNSDEFIPTRASLLKRLKDWSDEDSWKTFFETYWRLIYKTAIGAGLTDSEAQDVVQNTMISLSKSLPKFEYDPAKGSFKVWLKCMVEWRITAQLRKRGLASPMSDKTCSLRTATLERIPDPAKPLEALWDKEWQANLIEAAIRKVKLKVDPRHYQVFDLYVSKKWPVTKIAEAFGVTEGQVYLIKHRIAKQIAHEIKYLRTKII